MPPGDATINHGRRRLRNLGGISGAEHRQSGVDGLAIELVHFSQSDCDQNRVHRQRTLGSLDDGPILFHGGNDGLLHVLITLGSEYGVAREDRHAQAPQLVGVHGVPTYRGQELHHGCHVHPRLQCVVGRDESHVACAHHKKPPGTGHQISVHQCLEGAGADYAGEGVAWKR